MNKLIPKYRPVLTEDMMRECYGSLPEGDTKEYFRKFLLKIGAGLTSPGYIPTPARKNTIANSLGFTEQDEVEKPFVPYAEKNVSQLHVKWQQDPLSVTAEEIELIQTYRWENNLMTEEESQHYETTLLGN